jgi:hypothetical protein
VNKVVVVNLSCAGEAPTEADRCHLPAIECGVESVRDEVQLPPGDLVDEPEHQPLQREAKAEDDVVGAAYLQGAFGHEDALRLQQPPHVELEVILEPQRANRVTTPVAHPAVF